MGRIGPQAIVGAATTSTAPSEPRDMAPSEPRDMAATTAGEHPVERTSSADIGQGRRNPIDDTEGDT